MAYALLVLIIKGFKFHTLARLGMSYQEFCHTFAIAARSFFNNFDNKWKSETLLKMLDQEIFKEKRRQMLNNWTR